MSAGCRFDGSGDSHGYRRAAAVNRSRRRGGDGRGARSSAWVLGLAVLAPLASVASCSGGSAPGHGGDTSSSDDSGTTPTVDSSTRGSNDAGTLPNDAGSPGTGDGAAGPGDSSAGFADGSVPAPDGNTSVNDAAATAEVGMSTDAAPARGPYTCTEVLGLEITSEWWTAGFLSDGVAATRFQIKWHHQGYVGAWADADSPFWSNEGSAQNADAGAPIVAPCAKDSLTPDRVLLVAVDFDMLTEDAWVTALTDAVATIQAKYTPNLKWIDLATLVRCPNDTMCNPSADYGPGADLDVSREDCYVPRYVDSAIAKVIAANSALVGLGPEPQATTCDKPVNGPHLSAASNAAAAAAIAAYFVQQP
jgi:hypothetical protein